MGSRSASPIHLEARCLKALRHFAWEPSGVCALVGPNGSGKTTALRIVEVLRQSLLGGFDHGLGGLGAGPLKHLDAATTDIVEVGVGLRDAIWKIGIHGNSAVRETAEDDGVTLSRSPSGGKAVISFGKRSNQTMGLPADPKDPILSALLRSPNQSGSLVELARTVARSRSYGRTELEILRGSGSAIGPDLTLENGAKNLFTVLRNWRDTSEMEHRSQFVQERMAEMFPSDFRRLDFSSQGQRTFAVVVSPRWSQKLQPTDWSDGFLSTLASLTALASVDDEGVVAIDEPENSLHPALIIQFVEAARMWSKLRKVTVLFSTHSPVVLDQFTEEPERVFVMQPREQILPVALDKLKKKEWLQHFSIGDVYSHLEVGAPTT